MPRQKKLLRIILCLLIIFTGYISLLYLYKFILNKFESKIIPEIAKEIGIHNLSFRISNAGLFGADISSIHAGANTMEAPSIDSVRIIYTPAGLYKKYINKIIISGVKIQCELEDGKFNIRGFDLQSFISALSAKKQSSTQSAESFPIGSIELHNSTVAAYWKNQNIAIPLDLKIAPHDKNKKLLYCLINLFPRDMHIKIASEINLDTNKADISFSTKRLLIERFYDLLNFPPSINASGSADVDGKVQIFFSPFKISSMSCSISANNLLASFNDTKLTNSNDELSGKKLPFYIDIKNDGNNIWDFSASSFSIASPMPVKTSGIKCQITKSEDSIKAYGNFSICIDPSIKSNDSIYRIKNSINIKTDYFLSLSKTGNWKFKASGNSTKEKINANSLIKFQNFDVSSQNIKFELSGKGKKDKSNFKYIASILGFTGLSSSLSFKTPGIYVNGNADLINKSTIKGVYNISLNPAIFIAGSAVTDIPSFSLAGKFYKNSGSDLVCDNLVKFNDVDFKDSKLQVAISGIDGTMPFRWPLSSIKSEGIVVAKKILWKNINIGTFSGSIRPTDSGFLYNGRYVSIPFKGMNLDFLGNTDLFASNGYETEISFDTEKFKLSSDMDFYRLFPHAIGMFFGGNAELNGKLNFKEKKLTGFMNASIEEGSFKYEEKGISIEGIKANLTFPNVPSLTSATEQKLFFGRASIGSILLTDGVIDFQIEPQHALFIEKSRFKWCGGAVYTTALRVSASNKDLNLMLFCDRLNLAKLIEQFGLARAEGNGTVSGKIPIELRKGRLIFADGFLYSTPGDGGTIHLAEAKLMSENLIPGTSQFAQIELTLEALKNYIYDWAKLKFSTDEENLLLNLQFDGKPADVLPFKYDKKTGGFLRVKSAQEGSRFQGIRLDINFIVPLDKILYYKDILKTK